MNKSIGKYIYLSIFLLFTFYGCKDIYEPEIKLDENNLVVDGLITNNNGPHKVKLSKTDVFGSEYQNKPVTNASLKIFDKAGNEIILKEEDAGTYLTPDNFSGEIGEVYTLQITTEDGSIYKSEPQKLLPPIEIDEFYGEFGTETFFYKQEDGSSLFSQEVDGVNLFINVSSDNDRYPKFRFNSSLMLQYKFEPQGIEDPVYVYCWEKSDLTTVINRDIIKNLSKPKSKHNRIGFIPRRSSNMRHVGFPSTTVDTTAEYGPGDEDIVIINYLQPRIFINSVYALNEDAYSFHFERNQQINDGGSFFDPISPQISGNMYSVDDNEENVFGFFEVSSKASSFTVNVRPEADYNIVNLDTLDCLDHLPDSGSSFDEKPDWWIE